jgi:hypothetical protein
VRADQCGTPGRWQSLVNPQADWLKPSWFTKVRDQTFQKRQRPAFTLVRQSQEEPKLPFRDQRE